MTAPLPKFGKVHFRCCPVLLCRGLWYRCLLCQEQAGVARKPTADL